VRDLVNRRLDDRDRDSERSGDSQEEGHGAAEGGSATHAIFSCCRDSRRSWPSRQQAILRSLLEVAQLALSRPSQGLRVQLVQVGGAAPPRPPVG